jgi:hypothetical protein
LSVAINATVSKLDGTKAELSLTPTGGQGTLLAAQWTCPDGTKLSGLNVICSRMPANGVIQVTAWDGAGNAVSAGVTAP